VRVCHIAENEKMSIQEKFFVLTTFMVAAAAGWAQSPTPLATQATGTTAPPTTTSAPATTGGPLAGRWRFNVDKSDDAREKMREARERQRGEGGGGRGGWGGGGGGMGGGGMGGGGRGGGGWGGGMGGRGRAREGGDGQEIQRQGNMSRLVDPPEELTISQNDAEITILEKDGAIRVLHPDGTKHKTDNGGSEIRTRWDKDKLVVETEPPRGGKLTETFVVASDKKHLTEDVRLDGRLTVTVRRVYDAIPTE
jgi:hypothetical protein